MLVVNRFPRPDAEQTWHSDFVLQGETDTVGLVFGSYHHWKIIFQAREVARLNLVSPTSPIQVQ
jgi:hypothetical protein